MFHRTFLHVSVAMFLSACTCSNEEVEVTILPSQYKVGNVASKLATPVVDEVVKLKPRAVHIHTCTATPPERVLQFNSILNLTLGMKRRKPCPSPQQGAESDRLKDMRISPASHRVES